MNNKYDATREEWDELFELAIKLYDLKLWDEFDDVDFIRLSEKQYNSYSLVSVMGKNKVTYGISLAIGNKGARGYHYMLLDDKNVSEMDIAFRQESINLYFENEKDFFNFYSPSTRDSMIYKIYGTTVIYFKRIKHSHYPYDLEKEDVVYAIKYYSLLIDAYEKYKSENIKIDYPSGEIYSYYYDNFNKKYTYKIDYAGKYLEEVDEFELFPEDEKKILKFKKGNKELEVDINYIEAGVFPGYHKNYSISRLISIVDHETGLNLSGDVIKYNDNENTKILDVLFNLIHQMKERPKKIIVRNRLVFALLICSIDSLDIELVIDDMPMTDLMLDAINENMDDTSTIDGIQ